MEWLHDLFKRSPEMALFLSLAVGYWIGKLKFGKFQLGGVAGSLLVAVVVSQVGVTVDDGVKAVLFALFIYAVGFESGPQFFSSLGRRTVKEIVLAAVMALTGLATVVIMARLFGLDKGLAAGVAAGGLTQSAIIGTAGDAIAKLGLAADETSRLQANVAIGYAVTYVFGSFGAIIVCVNILPKFMGRSIRDDAIAEETRQQAGAAALGPDQQAAAPPLVGRIYELTTDPKRTVADIEYANPATTITIERVKRGGKFIEVGPDLKLQQGDLVLVVGRRDAVVASAPLMGKELYDVDGMELTMQKREVVLTNKEFDHKTIEQIRQETAGGARHGIFVVQISRMGKPLPMKGDTVVQVGDLVSIFGAEQDVRRVSAHIGEVIVSSIKTDFVYLGAGLVVGLLIGLLSVKLGDIPLTLGSGGGALLSGLLFGWYRAKRQTFGELPAGAVQLLKDLGLAGFVVVVGLSSGLQAVKTIQQLGLTIFGVGVVVTIVPMLITMVFGRYVLRYDNVASFAGALSGSRSANPAFGEVLDKAENSIPTVPFAITYALANVFLTLLGPLIVALV
ncbi:aspartate-alanine antiporter [Variovorax saccharolyticus]|uniref:aspartate-alanine antiporter n=1 Tax=Variovorax saccharolyticus TaxID=3053516 RepID=UPI0025770340|nr:aspartate-alanine antiporter [Variovorax sp. J31P216]MDM0025652.1 aspartate-alanine antiporter [Variovorax sp. J31P216]